MHDNDSFRLIDPDEAVAIAVALIAFLAFSGALAPEPKVAAKPAAVQQLEHCQKEAARYSRQLLQILNEPAVISIDGQPQATCRIVKGRK